MLRFLLRVAAVVVAVLAAWLLAAVMAGIFTVVVYGIGMWSFITYAFAGAPRGWDAVFWLLLAVMAYIFITVTRWVLTLGGTLNERRHR